MGKCVYESSYSTGIVSFIDLLGFKDLITRTEQHNKEAKLLIGGIYHHFTTALHLCKNYSTGYAELFNIMSEDDPWVEKMESTPDNQIRHSLFSDSIFLSIQENDYFALRAMLHVLAILTQEFAQMGVLFRGAVVAGDFFHKENIVFGPALNQAYYLESKCAIYPRVIIESDLIDSLDEDFEDGFNGKSDLLDHLVSQDNDAFYYLDIFKVWGSQSTYYQPYLPIIRNLLIKNLSNKNPSVKQKYEWLKPKFNRWLSMQQEGLSPDDPSFLNPV